VVDHELRGNCLVCEQFMLKKALESLAKKIEQAQQVGIFFLTIMTMRINLYLRLG